MRYRDNKKMLNLSPFATEPGKHSFLQGVKNENRALSNIIKG